MRRMNDTKKEVLVLEIIACDMAITYPAIHRHQTIDVHGFGTHIT